MSIVGSEQWMYSSGAEFYDFPIEQSLRFNDGDSAYLSRTPASAGNRKTWTWSGWVKRSYIGATSGAGTGLFGAGILGNNANFRALFDSDKIYLQETVQNVSNQLIWTSTPVFRDASAWYNIVIAMDTTQASSADRVKVYVNGTEISGSFSVTPAQNQDTSINNNTPQYIGASPYNSAALYHYHGYLADVNVIDGQALDPTSFGETKSGIWIPKDTSGLTFGTNGFRLQFGDTTEANGFNTVLWEGNGTATTTTNVVQGFGFSPDFVWFKRRDDARDHFLYDTVRGASTYLHSNGTNADATDTTYGLQSFDADGFTVTGNSAWSNNNGSPYVAWAWDAGSGSAASNTDGSITSTVKANTDYGFSIVSYTGTGSSMTFGHGLGVTPDLFIVKKRNSADEWIVYPLAATGNLTQYLKLHTTSAYSSDSVLESATSSVIGFGSSGARNGSGDDYIAYCFAEKAGYSKFGSYTGTGAAGNSITTGFKPAFVMFKRTDSTSDWFMLDNTRDTNNPIDKKLEANTSGAEVVNAAYETDFNSDGFVLQNTNAQLNASGGTYIYMAFQDTRNAAFWKDTSGQGNDWQPNNLVFSDVVPDSVSNNFAVVPSTTLKSTGYSQHTEGNLQLYQPSWGGWDINIANFNLPSSGKYYWEVMPVQGIFNAGYGAFIFGIGNIRGRENISGFPTFGNPLIQVDSRGIGEYRQYPAWVDYTKSGSFGFTVGSTVYGIAVDCDAKKFWFSLDNSWAGTSGTTLTAGTGDPANGTNGDPISGDITDYVPFFNVGDQQSSCKLGINFGQDSTFAGARAAGGNADENGYGDFAYAPPSGFLSLCSANLPSGAIDTLADETPEDYFSTLTYSGTGATNSLTGVGFQPSLTWIKQRTQAYHHELYDAVRGVQKMLQSSSTQQETTETQGLLSFDSDGFTVGTRTNVNQNSTNLVSWNWKANGSGVSNTDGSITSTVSVGATSQQNWFSVASFTGTGANATVGHGLGVTPDMIIVKGRDNTDQWFVYHTGTSSSPENDYIYLNLTSAKITGGANPWNGTAHTSSVFNLGSDGGVNGSSLDYIAYCFANAEGLCKVGSYTGNGSADGTFVYTGFRPAWWLVKSSSASGEPWMLMDNKRDSYNLNDAQLQAQDSRAESNDGNGIDFLSNGIKIRSNIGNWGTNGVTYIYLAIAEQPFKFANAR